MTTKLYENDSELFQQTAKILNIGKKEIKLLNEKNQPYLKECGFIETDVTIFHPQGGGQSADRGCINDINIMHVAIEKNNNQHEHIYHYFDLEKYPHQLSTLKLHDTLQMKLDANFRHLCSRYHSAGHILGHIVETNSIFESLHTKAVRGNHFPNQAFVFFEYNAEMGAPDFLTDDNANKKILDILQQKLDEAITKTKSTEITQDNNIRIITVGDAKMPCGGTHVKNTSNLVGTMIKEITREKTKSPGKLAFKIKYSVKG